MKKDRGFSKAIAVFAALLMFFCGMQTVQAHPQDVYMDVLAKFYGVLKGRIPYHALGAAVTGIAEVREGMGEADALSHLGFVFLDVSGDGQPELLIGGIPDPERMPWCTGELFAVYGPGNPPVLLFSGWARHPWYLMAGGEDDPVFYSVGSNGASYSSIGTYGISTDGRSLSPREFWFTDDPMPGEREPSCYYNRTGKWDIAASERLDISMDDFLNTWDGLEAQRKMIDFTPFSEYEEYMASRKNRLVYLKMVTEDQLGGAYWDLLQNSPEEYGAMAAFYTEEIVRRFTVMNLRLHDETGTFLVHPIFSQEVLTKDNPCMVRMPVPEVVPHIGISYEDSRGEIHYLSVNISGKDGSFHLIPFEVAGEF